MEYVCRVGTPTGEVVEQTFSAADEAALRTDLEQKGYYLFSVRRGLGLKDFGLRRPHVAPDLLLLFGQETAAAMAFFLRDWLRRMYWTNRRSIPSRLPLRSPAAMLAESIGG